MKALTVIPKTAASIALDDVPEPEGPDGAVLVETVAVGVCGTDMEIVRGDYGWAPPGRERLVLGHESLGRVLDAPAGSGLSVGDLVVGIVRRPDPVPCYSCAVGEWDACRNGEYTEHGIKQLDGFMRERWRANPDAMVKVDAHLGELGVLLEPTTVVAKAWEEIERIGGRQTWKPTTALVVGAGPIGLLAALLGVERGLDVHVVDQMASGLKPDLVRALGATYHAGALADAVRGPDVVIECTGVPRLAFDAVAAVGIGGVVCLAGVSPTGVGLELDAGSLARSMVLENTCVVGSVNANTRHYRAGAEALARADRDWLARLVTRRVPVTSFADAFEHGPDDVKVVIELAT
ncbi:MAG TPA: glucose 1-dehydrogenase [Acidimicrobiales bacterium]|nr:glucose 1-dehydrogenase [Acidimicrobiales bacterium]